MGLSLIYCCLNTLIGYGSFGEALNHWDASKVSIVTTLIPVFTMIFSTIGHHLAPIICRFGYEYRQLCGCHGGCGRGIAGCGRRESDGAFFEKDIKHLLRNRIKQGRLKQVADGLYISKSD